MAAVDRSTVNIKVRVRFVAARNLKNVQMVGKQDPFIKAQLFGKEFKSATNNDGGKNPIWNGGNVMMVENTWDMFTERNELLGSIRDEGAMGSTLIGTFKIPSRRLAEGNVDDWVHVTSDGAHQGELHVVTELLQGPPGLQAATAAVAAAEGVAAVAAKSFDYEACANKRGWMTKRGGFIKSWKKRMFQLRDNKLAYYETTGVGGGGVGKKGELDISFAQIEPARMDGQKYCIQIACRDGGRKLFVSCASDDDREAWLVALRAGSGGKYKDPQYIVTAKRVTGFTALPPATGPALANMGLHVAEPSAAPAPMPAPVPAPVQPAGVPPAAPPAVPVAAAAAVAAETAAEAAAAANPYPAPMDPTVPASEPVVAPPAGSGPDPATVNSVLSTMPAASTDPSYPTYTPASSVAATNAAAATAAAAGAATAAAYAAAAGAAPASAGYPGAAPAGYPAAAAPAAGYPGAAPAGYPGAAPVAAAAATAAAAAAAAATPAGYPAPAGYPGAAPAGYPGAAPAGYPAASAGYPAASAGYPAASAGYPAASAGYPTASAGYPAASAGYPAATPSYAAPATGYATAAPVPTPVAVGQQGYGGTAGRPNYVVPAGGVVPAVAPVPVPMAGRGPGFVPGAGLAMQEMAMQQAAAAQAMAVQAEARAVEQAALAQQRAMASMAMAGPGMMGPGMMGPGMMGPGAGLMGPNVVRQEMAMEREMRRERREMRAEMRAERQMNRALAEEMYRDNIF